MRIRTTEPIADTNNNVWPTGTEATFVEDGKTKWGGKDFATDDGATLWALVPSQYEVIETDRPGYDRDPRGLFMEDAEK